MPDQQSQKILLQTPSFIHAFCTMAIIIVTISGGLFFLHTSLHSLLLICILVASTSARMLGYDYTTIRQAMHSGISSALTAIYIFILIGVLIAAFIASGTISTLIYYGISLLHPAILLPASLVLCSFMSIATGTSWGTVGTIGVVLMGISTTLGIPAPLMAGVIVSGACFGDKMSIVSDTTNLAAMAAKTQLDRHIRSMTYTTAPTYLLTLVIFTVVGTKFACEPLPVSALNTIQGAIAQHFNLSPITLLPIVLMLGLSVARIPAEPALLTSSITAVVIAVFLQDQTLPSVLTTLYDGNKTHTGIASVDHVLDRGGIASMMWTLSLSLMALALGGILERCQFLYILISVLVKQIKRKATLIFVTLTGCFFGNVTMGEAYMSIILGGQLFGEAYDQKNIARFVLSRSLEEGATLTTALIPWTTGGAFFASTLGVKVLDFAPWALLNWLNFIISVVFAYLGIALFTTNTKHYQVEAQTG
ncbi:Na+/H+ antiporter NhaC [Candidatus Sororendozoicomonas aggregata]|uniref:Na+/H+ antiporter NhaC n=1 Tax=Candidatus Sororendozoicomonas aggregata TaxID=3073239 RepID=UPI002ED05DB3